MKKLLLLSALFAFGPWKPAFATWDITTPAGTEAKSLGDNRIRELKTDLQTTFQYEGDFPGSDTASPRFIVTHATGTTAQRPTGNARADGMFYLNTSSNCIETYDGNGWRCVGVLPSSSVTSIMLTPSLAGNGLGGGDSVALSVNVSTHMIIVGDTVTINAQGVDNSMIADQAVTAAKVTAALAGDGLAGGAGSNFSVNVSTNLLVIGDTITINTNGVNNNMMVDAGDFPTSMNSSTYTLASFGMAPILQMQQFTLNVASDVATTAFSRTLVGSITPKRSTSKILVIGAGNFACSGAGVCYATLYRDTTNLASSTGGFQTTTAPANNHTNMTYLDSPGTTSSTEYAIRTRVNGGGVTISVPGTDGGVFTTTATLLLVEIAQ